MANKLLVLSRAKNNGILLFKCYIPVLLLLLSGFGVFVVGAYANVHKKNSVDPSKYAGEKLEYKLSFLFFDEAAICSTYLRRSSDDPNVFEGVFVGETKGFVGWVTSYRKYTYTAKMRLVNNGTKLRTFYFKTNKKIGSKVSAFEKNFDYEKGIIKCVYTENGGRKREIFKIKKGRIYENIVSGFYNVRAAKAEEGKHFDLTSFTAGKPSVFKIHFQTPHEKSESTFFSDSDKKNNFVLKIEIAKEIFGSKEGLLCVLMDKNYLPTKLVIEDVLIFGDVNGKLSGYE